MTSQIYVPDIEKWKRHFVRMAEGKTNPDRQGHYRVDSLQSGGEDRLNTKIKVVTPVAQAVELAKSELAQEREEAMTVPRVYKSKTLPTKTKRSPSNKRKKATTVRRSKKAKTENFPKWTW